MVSFLTLQTDVWTWFIWSQATASTGCGRRNALLHLASGCKWCQHVEFLYCCCYSLAAADVPWNQVLVWVCVHVLRFICYMQQCRRLQRDCCLPLCCCLHWTPNWSAYACINQALSIFSVSEHVNHTASTVCHQPTLIAWKARDSAEISCLTLTSLLASTAKQQILKGHALIDKNT